MHEDVPMWDDTPCCCEPEPRWQAVQDEKDERERQRRQERTSGDHRD